ncbi:MAG: S8 family serine peptidase, partial [Dehalococcoidia bacterium]
VRNPGVAYVELDGPVYALDQTVPWGIDRVFGEESYSFDTWDISRGDGIAVAVLDTGIDVNHEDLPALLGGENTIDSTHWGSDGNGHGTHVAGTVAALDNTWGVVGVGPQVGLYAVKVLDASGGGTVASVVGGIDWAVQQGIPILNMSLGTSSHVQSLQDACDAAYAAGHLLVAAAGNSGNPAGRGDNVGYPAKYDSVIAVAASASNDRRASFSSTGAAVELIAPGSGILSTLPDNKYGTYSGTSMASPHVAGAAALVWAADPGLTNVELRAILQQTAEDLGLPSNHQGHGLVRADLAVREVADVEPPPPPEEYDLGVSSTTGGSVTEPGEGTFTYEEGSVVDLVAVADSGYVFVEWTGDTGTIADVNAASTTITMNGDYSITATFAESTAEGVVRVESITYSTRGGRYNDRHLDITLLLLDDEENPVADASVSATLHRDDGSSWDFGGTTGSDGTVTFSLNNHGSGCYTTEIIDAAHDDLTWAGDYPEMWSEDNTYCK